MKQLVVTVFVALCLATLAFGTDESHKDKAEKAAFKRQLKDQLADCKHHPHTVACNDLKERQRMEKHQFKEAAKADRDKRRNNLERNCK